MNEIIVLYTHRHGQDVWMINCDLTISQLDRLADSDPALVADAIGIENYEPNRNESFEFRAITTKKDQLDVHLRTAYATMRVTS